MKKTTVFIISFCFCMAFILSACSRNNKNDSGEVGIASLSDDAHYAITTDAKGYVIFWALQQHQKRIIDTNVNLYGAGWIKGTNNYFYQLKDNEVVVNNINGQQIKKFNPGFLSDGSIITSDLKHYIGVDYDWSGYWLDIDSGGKVFGLMDKMGWFFSW